jgi:acetoin utilization protein AcuB
MHTPGSTTYGTVRDWMTREPVSVAPDYPVRRALALMEQRGVRHLLVIDGDRLTGIVSNRDVRRLLGGGASPRPSLTAPVSRIMSEGPVTVPVDTSIAVAARLLLDGRIGALPVRDGERVVGIFTTADALDALLALVEEPGR